MEAAGLGQLTDKTGFAQGINMLQPKCLIVKQATHNVLVLELLGCIKCVRICRVELLCKTIPHYAHSYVI